MNDKAKLDFIVDLHKRNSDKLEQSVVQPTLTKKFRKMTTKEINYIFCLAYAATQDECCSRFSA